jgi:hypothetical protein
VTQQAQGIFLDISRVIFSMIAYKFQVLVVYTVSSTNLRNSHHHDYIVQNPQNFTSTFLLFFKDSAPFSAIH